MVFLIGVFWHQYHRVSGEELEALGIPVELGKSYEIIDDDGDDITFKIYEYKNYVFTIKKENAPPNIKGLKKELIVFIDQKESAQELSNYKDPVSDHPIETPKVIQADEILILDDLRLEEGKDSLPASKQIAL